MGSKSIADLKSLTNADVSDNDLLLITDLSDKETKNIEVSEFKSYTIDKTTYLSRGSLTGSFYGKVYGTVTTSSNSNKSNLSYSSSFLIFNGDVNGTASYSITSSNSNFSLTSSNTVSSSYAVSASYSNISLFSHNSSSIKSISASFSYNAETSNISITSSYLNYYGQNNGTAHSSSFSEVCNSAAVADDILDKKSSIVRYAHNSVESFVTKYTDIAITSSNSSNAKIANSTLNRLFSSLEFRVSTNETNKTINITPISWKNIRNISAGSIGNLYTDFYVTYKNKPPFPIERQDEASNLATVTVGSFQLGPDNLIRNVAPNTKKPVPIFTSYVFPCGVDGYVIRFVNCTLYGEKRRKTGGILGDIFSFVQGLFGGGSRVSRRSTNVSNNKGPVYWATQLNGVVVSAQTFCNTVNFLDMGPPNTLSQYQQFVSPRAGNRILTKSVSYVGFPQESNTLYDIFKWYPQPPTDKQDSISQEVPYNVVKSIAHASGSNYNLLLLENDTYYPIFLGRQIALVEGKTFYQNSLHFPKTGSSISASVSNVNYLYYNTSSKDYLCVANSKILYLSSSIVHNYTGSAVYGNNLYLQELQPYLPIWNQYVTNLISCSRISHITGNRYLLTDGSKYTLKNNGQNSSGMPIYIIPDITNQSTALIQCNDVYNNMLKSVNMTLGYKGDVAGLPQVEITSTNYTGNYRKVNITETRFKNIVVLDSKRAIVGGDNGIIVYSNNIDSVTPTWTRIDPLSPSHPNTSLYLNASTEYLVEINDMYLLNVNSTKVIVVCGKDTSGRASMINCVIPTTDDTVVFNWEWRGVPGLFFQDSLDVDSSGNLLPSQIGSSSFQSVFRDYNTNVIVAGYSTFPTSSYYRYGVNRENIPYQIGSYNTSSIINSIGKIENEMYIFGGKNTLDLYTIQL